MFFPSVTERFSNPPEATIFMGNGLALVANLVTQNHIVFKLDRSADVLKNVTGGGWVVAVFLLIFPPRILQIGIVKYIGLFGCSCLEGTEHQVIPRL